MGWTAVKALFAREVRRFIRNWRNTVVPPLITNALYIIVFGSILGTRIDTIQGYAYIDFILPGLVMLGAIMNSFENTSFSIFHARWDDYIDEILTSPMSYREMLLAYIAAAVIRGLLVGGLILAIAMLFTELTVLNPLLFLVFLFLATTLFAAFGIVVALHADEFGDLSTFTNFLITPLVFLGGVFYSLTMLPELWRAVSYLNPMTFIVNGLRYSMLNVSDIDPAISLIALATAVVVMLGIDVYLFRTGYGLRE